MENTRTITSTINRTDRDALAADVGEATQPVWAAPAPGPWQQDSSHMPDPSTALIVELYPPAFNKGFEVTLAPWGSLMDRLAMATVNGFTYHQPQPFDMPGPDGPKHEAWIHAEIGRRAGLAKDAFANEIWRDALRDWDEVRKPAAIAAHAAIGSVDLGPLDTTGLRHHVQRCIDHAKAMVLQHHTFNAPAMIPVGDFALHASAWTGETQVAVLGVLDGYSPVSGLVSPEALGAITALRADPEALAMLRDSTHDAGLLAVLSERLPGVCAYAEQVAFRLIDGFDIDRPTLRECPEVLLGKLAAGVVTDEGAARRRADAYALSLAAKVPPEHRDEFDVLLGAARSVYRLRDERGVHSDVVAFGLLRTAVLEVGRRLVGLGRIDRIEDALEAGSAELLGLIDGAATPTAAELAHRSSSRLLLRVGGAPRYLGDPPPPMPPIDELPPPIARVMRALLFMVDGILGEMADVTADGNMIVGIGGNSGVFEGTARLVTTVDDLFSIEPGEVLVVSATGEAFNAFLHLVGAVVTDHGSFASHAAIMAREIGFPAVVGTVNATKRIATGTRVRVDGSSGTVTMLS